MKLIDGRIFLSATDLANHLGCRHLTALDQATAQGRLQPPTWRDPALEVLQKRGFEHERAYLAHLAATEGLQAVRLDADGPDASDANSSNSAVQQTIAAMQAGHPLIVQASLASGRWRGRADILRRVATPSGLGAWSYEVVDTKLARETRGGTILQLCLYSELVAEIQGVMPQHMHVVVPGTDFKPETHRLDDFISYYRLVRSRLEATVAPQAGAETGAGAASAAVPAAAPPPSPDTTYPHPVPQCDICRWWSHCDAQRRRDDNPCLVAGVSRLHTRELARWGVDTLTALARLPLPLPHKPSRGARKTYERAREQARLQLASRDRSVPAWELLPHEAGQGLARLPPPSPGDIFFDIEGDAFVGVVGLEYLFGWVTTDDAGQARYQSRWALNPDEERRALEDFVDLVLARWQRHPDLHIYHFGAYDPGALKRLASRYATREADLDRMLRGGLFVDLLSVVRQGLRVGVERYSIKDLEPLYGLEREMDLREASAARRTLEHLLELRQGHDATAELERTVETYNRDDCVSALSLRDWLEQRRAELEASLGEPLPRPPRATTLPATRSTSASKPYRS